MSRSIPINCFDSPGFLLLDGVTGYLIDDNKAITLIYDSGRLLPLGRNNDTLLSELRKFLG